MSVQVSKGRDGSAKGRGASKEGGGGSATGRGEENEGGRGEKDRGRETSERARGDRETPKTGRRKYASELVIFELNTKLSRPIQKNIIELCGCVCVLERRRRNSTERRGRKTEEGERKTLPERGG